MAHVDQVKKITTLCLPTEEYLRKATTDDHGMKYINMILSGTEETYI